MSDFFKKAASSWTAALIIAFLLSSLSVIWFGYSSYDVDGVRLGFRIEPAKRGVTELSIPPFGEISAFTHKTNVRIKVVLEKIYPVEISRVAGNIDNSKELVGKIEFEGKKAFKQFVIRLIVLAAIGGALGAALSPRRRAYKAIAGAALGAALISTIIVSTYSSYDINAFKQPRYSGALTVAPWATEDIAKRLGDVKTFRREVLDVARNIDNFYSKIDSWQPIQENTIKVLHVSDIHNNPVAIDLIKRVVKDFRIDLVIDTGDITDFGTPVEANLIDGIAGLPVPYIFIPGNHDSPQTVSFLRGVKNVTVVDGNVVSVKGITIFGIADPASRSPEPTPVDDRAMAEFKAQVADSLKSLPDKPLILAVHNPKAVRGLFGKAPIILVGHTHKASLMEKNGFVLNNAGTTGAAGFRTFQAQDGVPYTLNILHIDRTRKALVAIDSLEVTGAEREFRLERNLIEGKPALRNELGTLGRK
ncbi:MAG: metallophosphoesterase [Firmicutes bacterium]|nr:metallophosphoesterase [Bacillota bacterium]